MAHVRETPRRIPFSRKWIAGIVCGLLLFSPHGKKFLRGAYDCVAAIPSWWRGLPSGEDSWRRKGHLRGEWFANAPQYAHNPAGGEIPVLVDVSNGQMLIRDTLPPQRTNGFTARLLRGNDSFGGVVWRGVFVHKYLRPTRHNQCEAENGKWVGGIIDLDDLYRGVTFQAYGALEWRDPNPADYARLRRLVAERPPDYTAGETIKLVLR